MRQRHAVLHQVHDCVGREILQLRQHIATLSPPGMAFSLRGGFPPKPLADESLTLKDANLLNETIVQSS